MKSIRTFFLILFVACCFNGMAQSNTLVFTVPIASIGTDTTINFSLSNNVVWSCQINSVALTGTLDGTVDLEQSNDGVNFNALAGFVTHTLNVADASLSFENDFFSHSRFQIRLTKNNLTGGIVTFIFVYKKLQ